MLCTFALARLLADADVLLHLLRHYDHHGSPAQLWRVKVFRCSEFEVMLTFARVSIFRAFLNLMKQSKAGLPCLPSSVNSKLVIEPCFLAGLSLTSLVTVLIDRCAA